MTEADGPVGGATSDARPTGRIRRLSPELANQIAAGEVVERPASIVKELVENALDANAGRIAIVVEGGGKRLVAVEDDGEGMAAGDVTLALERHATSKITVADDLAAIVTRGFRGEALPSMASVSRLRLRSRTAHDTHATEALVEAGVTTAVRAASGAVGTRVEVRDLFFNVPARRKFLKSDAAEAAQVSRVVTQLALASPTVGFSLRSGERWVVRCPPASDLAERFHQLYGERADLVRVDKRAGGLHFVGYVASLTDQGPIRGPQNVFVNGRIVKDRTIAHAIAEAYSVATIKARSPEVHLFLDVPADRVDVNVHPTKAEVRFLEQSLVHEVVRRALADALGRERAPELQLRAPRIGEPEPSPRPIPEVFDAHSTDRWSANVAAFGRSTAGDAAGAPSAASGDSPASTLSPMVPLGQFRDTFIIAVDQEGVAIIDQHVAHERVLFERVMERMAAGGLESQRLLEPRVVELPEAQRRVLLARRIDLERFGFEIEEFGGEALRVWALPALLRAGECEAALRAVSDDLDGLESGAPVEEALRRIAATTACHAAVRAHDPLSLEQMRHILDELKRTAYSTVCPHGRPVVLRLTRREIEKNFQRI